MKGRKEKIREACRVHDMERELEALLALPENEVDEIESKLTGILNRRVVTKVDESVIGVLREQLDKDLTVSDIEAQVNAILEDGRISPLEAELLPVLRQKLDETLKKEREADAFTALRAQAERFTRAAEKADPYERIVSDGAADRLLDLVAYGTASEPAAVEIPFEHSEEVVSSAPPSAPESVPSENVTPERVPPEQKAAEIPPPRHMFVPMGDGLYFCAADGKTYRARARKRRGLFARKD